MITKCITINDGITMTAVALASHLFTAAAAAIKIISNRSKYAHIIAAVSLFFRMVC